MKYPTIVIGNVRYEPYALMEMEGDEVVSFKTLGRGARIVGKQKKGHWLDRLRYWIKSKVVI